ncbi:hypothetical protein LSAT2_004023, partial [Lamellibrachia satsuma]
DVPTVADRHQTMGDNQIITYHRTTIDSHHQTTIDSHTLADHHTTIDSHTLADHETMTKSRVLADQKTMRGSHKTDKQAVASENIVIQRSDPQG